MSQVEEQTNDLLAGIAEEEAAQNTPVAETSDVTSADVGEVPTIVDLNVPVETTASDAAPESETPVKTPTKAELAKAERERKAAEKAEAKRLKDEKKEVDKKAKEEAKKAKEVAKKEPKVEQPVQNGQRHPSPNTSAAAIWALINEVSALKGELCKPADIIALIDTRPYINKAGVEVKITAGNVSPEFWTYKRFYGLTATTKEAAAQ